MFLAKLWTVWRHWGSPLAVEAPAGSTSTAGGTSTGGQTAA
jgi:hypothetical protein